MDMPTGLGSSRREVGGELVSARSFGAVEARVEVLRRRSMSPINWQFQQPTLSLLWFRSGVSSYELSVDGHCIRSRVAPGSSLALLPPSMQVEGCFKVDQYCDYIVALFDPAQVPDRLKERLAEPRIAFGDQAVQRGLIDLCQEAEREDEFFSIFFEGWSMQTLARLARVDVAAQINHGGLAPSRLSAVKEYVAETLTNGISVDEMARVALLSTRHFIRAFQESVGMTPYQYVLDVRLARAKDLLLNSKLSLTDIALACGYTHLQHFSTSFRADTGVAPSQYRRRQI